MRPEGLEGGRGGGRFGGRGGAEESFAVTRQMGEPLIRGI